MPDEEKTCGFGKCVPDHPLHCCHTARAACYDSGRKGLVLRGWICVFCGKKSRTLTLVRDIEEPNV